MRARCSRSITMSVQWLLFSWMGNTILLYSKRDSGADLIWQKGGTTRGVLAATTSCCSAARAWRTAGGLTDGPTHLSWKQLGERHTFVLELVEKEMIKGPGGKGEGGGELAEQSKDCAP